MRTSGVCAQCTGQRFFVVDELKFHGHAGPFKAVPAYFERGIFSDTSDLGRIERWICKSCGLIEDYAVDANEVLEAKSREPGSGVWVVDKTEPG